MHEADWIVLQRENSQAFGAKYFEVKKSQLWRFLLIAFDQPFVDRFYLEQQACNHANQGRQSQQM